MAKIKKFIKAARKGYEETGLPQVRAAWFEDGSTGDACDVLGVCVNCAALLGSGAVTLENLCEMSDADLFDLTHDTFNFTEDQLWKIINMNDIDHMKWPDILTRLDENGVVR